MRSNIADSENYITRDELATMMGSLLGKNPKRTLKFYEAIGLIPRATLMRGRRGGVYACYPRSIVDHLKKIKELQEKGLTLREIRDELRREQLERMIADRTGGTLEDWVAMLDLVRKYFKAGITERDMKVLAFLKQEEPELYRFVLRHIEIREKLRSLRKLKGGDHPQDHQEE